MLLELEHWNISGYIIREETKRQFLIGTESGKRAIKFEEKISEFE